MLSFGELRALGIAPLGGETTYFQTLIPTNNDYISGVRFDANLYNETTQKLTLNRKNRDDMNLATQYAFSTVKYYKDVSSIVKDFQIKFESQLEMLTTYYNPETAGYPRIAEASLLHLRALQLRQIMGDGKFIEYLKPWKTIYEDLKSFNIEDEYHEKIEPSRKYYLELYPHSPWFLNYVRNDLCEFLNEYGHLSYEHFKKLFKKNPNDRITIRELYDYFLYPLSSKYKSTVQLELSDLKLMLEPLPMMIETAKISKDRRPVIKSNEFKLAPHLNVSKDLLNIYVFKQQDRMSLNQWLQSHHLKAPVKLVKLKHN